MLKLHYQIPSNMSPLEILATMRHPIMFLQAFPRKLGILGTLWALFKVNSIADG